MRGIDRAPNDFVNVVVPEIVPGLLLLYLLRRASLIRLKVGLLREPNIVVTDVPVLVRGGEPVGVDARPLIPERTVALVFVSTVHDATIRAVNYAQTLEASETRAIYFDLDPEAAHRMQEQWGEIGMRIPLHIVEAPFRDLTRPMLEEVRRFTSRPGTIVLVVVPELIVSKWRHLLLHSQNALFVKRLFLFEPNVILSSVPYVLEDEPEPEAVPAELMDREAAVALCREKCLKETTVRHLISVEGVMRGLARRFEQDEDLWGLTGMFHDLDQDHTGDDAANHARLAAEWLGEAGVDERVINGVLAHAYEEYRTDLMSKAVVHADAVAGLLVAAALVRPERSAGMKVSSVKKKLKEKAFAPGVNREEVLDVEESIGLPLDEFLSVSIEGLQLVAPEIGL